MLLNCITKPMIIRVSTPMCLSLQIAMEQYLMTYETNPICCLYKNKNCVIIDMYRSTNIDTDAYMVRNIKGNRTLPSDKESYLLTTIESTELIGQKFYAKMYDKFDEHPELFTFESNEIVLKINSNPGISMRLYPHTYIEKTQYETSTFICIDMNEKCNYFAPNLTNFFCEKPLVELNRFVHQASKEIEKTIVDIFCDIYGIDLNNSIIDVTSKEILQIPQIEKYHAICNRCMHDEK